MVKVNKHVDVINPGVEWMEPLVYLWPLLLYFTTAPYITPAAWVQQGHNKIMLIKNLHATYRV